MFYVFKRRIFPFWVACFFIIIILQYNVRMKHKRDFFFQQLELPWQHPRSQLKFGPVQIVTLAFVFVLSAMLHVKSTSVSLVKYIRCNLIISEIWTVRFWQLNKRLHLENHVFSKMTQIIKRTSGTAINTKSSCLHL